MRRDTAQRLSQLYDVAEAARELLAEMRELRWLAGLPPDELYAESHLRTRLARLELPVEDP